MGYPVSAFAIDLKKLKPNKKLFDEIVEELDDELEENWDNFEDEIIREGAPLLARALYLLLQGKPGTEFGFQYGYALELVVKHLGEAVTEISLEAGFDDALDPLLKKARCPNTHDMLGRGVLPMKMPMPNDWPEIGTITAAGCIAGLGAMATIEALTDDEDALMVIGELRGWFEAAKKKKTGIVWFAY